MGPISDRRHACDTPADLSHLGPDYELPSVIEDSRSDDDLLRAPDPDAFGAFYARHARAVESFFARRTGDRALACDLASETFAAALVARRRFRPGGAPAAAWLYTIAARRLADHRRRAAAEQRLDDRLMAQRRTEPVHAPEPAPGDAGVARPAPALALLERLPREQRAAIAAHVVAGHDYREIARHSGVSEAGVRQRVSRGLAAMRRPAQVRLAAESVLDETVSYSFGAGHEAPLAICLPSRGLDCSSFVSLSLRRAGLLASDRALSSREIAVDWGVAGEGEHVTVWAGGGHAWLEFKLAGERAERLEVGPDASSWRTRVAAGERRPSEFQPRHWPGL
jgi:RNA polymerase sigma-70 factor (ECF subfamily)